MAKTTKGDRHSLRPLLSNMVYVGQVNATPAKV